MEDTLIYILKLSVLFTGILDSWKYKFLTQKVSRLKSSREISRKFINISILKNFVLLIACWVYLNDWAVMWSCIFSLYTGAEAFHAVYLHYPYKKRGLKNFKRPSIFKYFVNSVMPNKFTKRL